MSHQAKAPQAAVDVSSDNVPSGCCWDVLQAAVGMVPQAMSPQATVGCPPKLLWMSLRQCPSGHVAQVTVGCPPGHVAQVTVHVPQVTDVASGHVPQVTVDDPQVTVDVPQ